MLKLGLKDRVVDYGCDPSNKCVYIRLNVDNRILELAKINVVNNPKERSIFWSWLKDSLPKATWLITSVFNMVESKADTLGGWLVMMNVEEWVAWQQLKHVLALHDPNAHHDKLDHSLWSSWSNFRHGLWCILLRLDRVLLTTFNFQEDNGRPV